MNTTAPLTVPAFRRLATSYTLNELGWGFGTVALAVLVFQRTGSAMGTTALFMATAFLPALLAPALTARLDRLPVRRALPILYLVEAALFAALVLAAERFWLPLVLALALADGAVAIAGRALTRAAVAATLKPSGSLEAGNRLLNIAFSIAFAAGPGLAGLVVAAAGVSASLSVTAALFVVMAVTLATSTSLPGARADADGGWRERLAGGLRYVRENGAVRRVLGAHTAAMTFGAAVTPIEVVYVKESLGAGDLAYGLLLAAWGVGTVLSSVALARFGKASALVLIPLSAVAVGAGYLVMAGAWALPLALVGAAVGGMGNGVYYVSVVQALQERIADDFQARVMSLLESTTAACYGVGFLLGGVLATLTDPRLAIASAAAGVLVSAAAIVAMLREDRRRPAGPAPASARMRAPQPEAVA
jgi:predicted MFS family arabinose efflux permease